MKSGSSLQGRILSRRARSVLNDSAAKRLTLSQLAEPDSCCTSRSLIRCRNLIRSSALCSSDPTSSAVSCGDDDEDESSRVAPTSLGCCRCSAFSSPPECLAICSTCKGLPAVRLH